LAGPPSDALVERVASLLYREAVGHAGYKPDTAQLYNDLAPIVAYDYQGREVRFSNGALGSSPRIFIKSGAISGNNFTQDFRWVKSVDKNDWTQLELVSVSQFVEDEHVDWPDFAARLDEMNHKNSAGSRTGDIVLVMNGAQGYMAVCHGEDMLNGWHGGPEPAESFVPLMFGMPGPNLVVTQEQPIPAFVTQKYNDAAGQIGVPLRNWHMGAILQEIIGAVRTTNDP